MPDYGAYGYPYPGAPRGRIDQGVDFAAPGPALAIAAGTIIKISPPGSFVGGTGEAVYISMDVPYRAPSGRTYNQIYYAEQHPLVHMPGHVTVGTPVMAAGGSEIGFARYGEPACALVGGLGAGSKPTVCGVDMYDLLGLIVGLGALPLPPPQPPAPVQKVVHAPAAWADLMHALGHDLPHSLWQSRRARRRFTRLVR